MLDDRLVQALDDRTEVPAIRFVRSSWLLAQPPDFKMPYRQKLEEIELSGASPSPLLSPDEAEQLIRRGNRSVGSLT